MRRFSIVLALFFGFSVFALDTVAPLKITAHKGDKLEIVGYEGSVELIPTESNVVTVKLKKKSGLLNSDEFNDDWNFVLNKNEGVISVRVNGPHSKAKWNEILMGGKIPPFHMQITSPDIATEINWQKGKVVAQNWKSDLNVTQLEGLVSIKNSEGGLGINLQKGKVVVANYKGPVNIDAFNANVNVKNIEGETSIINFMGTSAVSQVEGRVDLDVYSGETRVSKVNGSVNFKSSRSPLRIADVEGAIKGRSGQGSVYLTLDGKSDVRVRTVEGKVQLKTRQSGAYVNVGSKEGSLIVPNFLKLTRYPTIKVRQGRLRGSKGGRIFVRTESGDIKLR